MSSRTLSLVLMEGANLVAEFPDYPVIPPLGHIFTLRQRGRQWPYRVTYTQSIIDLDEIQASNYSGSEAVRVDVELVH